MHRRWRLLHVVPTLGGGGAEYSLLAVATELARRGHSLEVCVLRGSLDLRPLFEKAGVTVHALGLGSWSDYPRGLAALNRLIATRHYDVVRSLMSEASIAVSLSLPARPPPPHVASFHALEFDAYPVKSALHRGYRLTYAKLMQTRAQAWVGISSAVCDHYQRNLGLGSIERIWNGFELEAIGRPDTEARSSSRAAFKLDGCFAVICPARIASDKGHAFLLEAAALLGKRGLPQPLLLVLAGAGPLEAALAQQAASLGIGSQVRFVGAMPQQKLFELLAACDVMALPTPAGEGFGRVIVEAMCCGTPVVTTAIGGALDIIRDGDTGLLVEPKSPVALADAIGRIASDEALARRLSDSAEVSARANFDIRSCADRWEDLFTRLTQPKGGV